MIAECWINDCFHDHTSFYLFSIIIHEKEKLVRNLYKFFLIYLIIRKKFLNLVKTKRGWDKSPSLSIIFGLSSKTQWLSGLYYADFISFYSPTQLCGGGTTKSNSIELPISVPLSNTVSVHHNVLALRECGQRKFTSDCLFFHSHGHPTPGLFRQLRMAQLIHLVRLLGQGIPRFLTDSGHDFYWFFQAFEMNLSLCRKS